jgi:hypothetical protein
MLTTLLSVALANSPLSATWSVEEDGEHARVASSVHLGLDLTGWRPGLGARLDLGQRVAVEGRVSGGLPLADGLSWTGGGRLGVVVAPIEVELGSSGSLAVHLGTGLQAETKIGGNARGPWTLGGWLSSTLELSPDGRWTLFGGIVADDEGDVVPTAGVRVRLPD